MFLRHLFMVNTVTWPHQSSGPRMTGQSAVNAPDRFLVDGSASSAAQAIVRGLTRVD